jgi:hypothetical protein
MLNMNINDNRSQQAPKLNPEKLFVEYRNGVTAKEPVLHRHYTLTHSDITAALFLTVGLAFAWDKTNSTRDEVLAEWLIQDGLAYILYGYLYVDDPSKTGQTLRRDRIFRRELPLALEAICYGEQGCFSVHPDLLQAPIWIYFGSIDPRYQRLEYWGVPANYLGVAE